MTWRRRRDGCGLLLAGLVLLSLAWGALATFTAVQYASATSSVVTAREPLSLDAQRIYSKLSDANDAATTAFLTGGIEPAATRQRYLADIAAAGAGIESATAQGERGTAGAAADLSTLAEQLPAYNGEIETARADNRLGLPLGAAYLREASALMRSTLLAKAKDLYAAENASLSGTSAQATGLPLVCVTGAVGLLVVFLLYRASRWLRGRTNRVLNVGLVAAGSVAVVSLAWLAVAYAAGRSDLLAAQARGSATVEAVAQVGIAAQEAHADESITLIDNTGDDTYQGDYQDKMHALGPGPGTLLTAAQTAARAPRPRRRWRPRSATRGPGSPLTRRSGPWTTWAITPRRSPRSSAPAGRRRRVLRPAVARPRTALDSDQAVFDSTARSAASAYTGLQAGLIAAGLIMAGACAWGLSRRLVEYR